MKEKQGLGVKPLDNSANIYLYLLDGNKTKKYLQTYEHIQCTHYINKHYMYTNNEHDIDLYFYENAQRLLKQNAR